MRVTRTLVYEGTDERVLMTLTKSLADGTNSFGDLIIQVSTVPCVGVQLPEGIRVDVDSKLPGNKGE